jgi:hypothetical protein
VVYVTNFPDPQNVTGTVTVGNLPTVQYVMGAVSVDNLPLDPDGNLMIAPSGISNLVLDLLDEPVLPPWESEEFDVSRFNRLILKGHATAADGIICQVSWRFSDSDEFMFAGNHIGFYYGPDQRVDMSIWGNSAKVHCDSGTGSIPISDIRVLLRRE